jgi:hypothetical protein
MEGGADAADKTQNSKTFVSPNSFPFSLQEVMFLSAPLLHFVLVLFSLFFALDLTRI